MPIDSTPFPSLAFDPADPWEWPSPPLDWPHISAPIKGIPRKCAIEGPSTERVRGELVDFDPSAGRVALRAAAGSAPGWLAFSRFRRLTLVEPLRAAAPIAGEPSRRIPVARQERDYTLWSSRSAATPWTSGRTAGHVETEAGLFLFTPVDEEAALQRVFVPRWTYSHCEFGPSAEEIAARLWISSPHELLEAIERQDRMPVLPIGQSMLSLGLLTQAQLERELAKPASDKPLGESLVAAGVISRADLKMAIAHKMGYPMVDLTRFALDPLALTQVPKDMVARHRILPLMFDQGRVIVAVDSPLRFTDLRGLHIHLQATLVPVLASALQITVAIDRISRDVWSHQVVGRPSFVPPS